MGDAWRAEVIIAIPGYVPHVILSNHCRIVEFLGDGKPVGENTHRASVVGR